MPEIEVLSQTPYSWINEKGQLTESTFVVYKDQQGRVGSIVVKKAKPTQAEIEAEIKKRQAGP